VLRLLKNVSLFFFCKKYLGIPYGPYGFSFGDTVYLRDTENNQSGMQKTSLVILRHAVVSINVQAESWKRCTYTNADAIWPIFNLQ